MGLRLVHLYLNNCKVYLGGTAYMLLLLAGVV